MRTRHVIGLLAALTLMACSEMGIGARQGGSQETLTSASATVEAINQSTREVRLRDNADGTSFVVTAGPEVRNLAQVEVGDQVNVDFYRSITASMADPADTGEAATAVVAGQAPEGSRPGVLAATSESMVVTVVNYDNNSGIATFRTPDGFTRTAAVPPNLRSFARARGPGSRVLVTMTDAVAVSVTEASPS
ncbi:hypothetical protein [Amaricoccus sp.]|uniref:hypothetical protein n=1 Tax=Amaricoccus sp. TaxID=1872485 RepID=UPI00260C3BEA|nr:hypothetical protein [Amaricoccus sp.]HRO13142.1 hypothetical protein [Amaricoccus sp.]